MSKRVCAIVVTYNRKALLRECLSALQVQTRPVDEVLIVNNASTDGTEQMLEDEFGDCRRLDLSINIGGAGGFHEGIKWAYKHGYDWFWCMDDDTIPLPDCLEKLTANRYFLDGSTGFLASIVRWKDGSLHEMNMHSPANTMEWYGTVLDDKCVPITTTSFVSVLISRAAVAKVGLPIKEFFVWYDDMEYTCRVTKYFTGYYVLDSVVVHKTASNQPPDLKRYKPTDYGKYTYGLRNQVVCLKLRDEDVLRKSMRITQNIIKNTSAIIRYKAPLNLILAMLRGLFFSPKIEMVETKSGVAQSKCDG